MICALFDFYLHGPSILLQMMQIYSFLWLNVIPQCVCVPHFLYSSISGHFGYFCVFTIIKNNAAMNMEIKISFQVNVFVFSLDK